MTTLQFLPVLAYAAAALAILATATGRGPDGAARWLVPAALGALFLAFTLATVASDGLLQFWANHTADLTGNQVWFDLLIAVTLCFVLIAPRARAAGMPLLPWAVAVILTACVALLPMVARLMWLEARAARAPQPASSSATSA